MKADIRCEGRQQGKHLLEKLVRVAHALEFSGGLRMIVLVRVPDTDLELNSKGRVRRIWREQIEGQGLVQGGGTRARRPCACRSVLTQDLGEKVEGQGLVGRGRNVGRPFERVPLVGILHIVQGELEAETQLGCCLFLGHFGRHPLLLERLLAMNLELGFPLQRSP